jgi:hypothetical protein
MCKCWRKAIAYTAILGGSIIPFLYFRSSVNCLVTPTVHIKGNRATETEFVPFSATPEAADLLTFGYKVRPEIRRGRSPPTTSPCCPQASHSRPQGNTKHAKDTCGNFAIG